MNQAPKIYLARAGGSGEDEDRALEHNIAIVGFQEVLSLAAATDYEGVHKIVTRAFPDAKPRAVGNFAGQLWAFAVAMKEGDLVVLPRKLTSQIAIGRVTGPYEYSEGGRHVPSYTLCGVATDGPSSNGLRAGSPLLVRRVHDCLQHLTQ